MEQTQYIEIASTAINNIKATFPNLATIDDLDNKNVDLSVNIPRQAHLDFDINLNLQTDELFISTEYFWGSWFSIKDSEVVDLYLEAVKGLITGDYRIVQYWNNNKLYKSHLQKPVGQTWETVYTAREKTIFPWTKLTEKVIRNKSYSVTKQIFSA